MLIDLENRVVTEDKYPGKIALRYHRGYWPKPGGGVFRVDEEGHTQVPDTESEFSAYRDWVYRPTGAHVDNYVIIGTRNGDTSDVPMGYEVSASSVHRSGSFSGQELTISFLEGFEWTFRISSTVLSQVPVAPLVSEGEYGVRWGKDKGAGDYIGISEPWVPTKKGARHFKTRDEAVRALLGGYGRIIRFK